MKILVSVSPGEIRAAAWDDGLVDYAIERPGAPDGVGDLHRGRVIARVPALAGAFVALAGAEGFLPDSQGADAVHAGSVLGVRITRASQGGKGPRLTARLTEDESSLFTAGPLALLRRGPGAAERLAELHPEAPVQVDDPALSAHLRPRLGDRLRQGQLFAIFFPDAVEAEIEALGANVAGLPGGGRMTVTPTSALTAIDIDLGAATADRRAKAPAQLHANRALLPALARQIRLRNLGGAIVVDLAGMSARRRAALGPDFAAALARDPLHPRFLGFSALGLAEVLRPRVHPPLHELLSSPHAAGLAALRRAAAEIAARPQQALGLRVSAAVADALQADPVALAEFAARAGQPLRPRLDRTLPPLGWTLEDEGRA